MLQELQRLVPFAAFLIWVVPRVIPLLVSPGVYSFDAWIHMGYVEAVLVDNRIPPLDPIQNPYVCTPFLHLFTILVHAFLGLPLIETFRLCYTALVVLGFFAFLYLFRTLLGNPLHGALALLLFSVEVDVLSQTQCLIPENLALIYLALVLAGSIKVIRHSRGTNIQILLLAFFVVALVFSHQLTSLFAMYFALALLPASALTKNAKSRRRGILIASSLFISLLLLLALSSPLMATLFRRYALLLVLGTGSVAIATGFLYCYRERVWHFLHALRSDRPKTAFLAIGLVAGTGLFAATLVLYPYERPPLWVAFKFGLLSCLLGLSVSAVPLMSEADKKTSIAGLFLLSVAVLLGLSFTYTSVIQFILLAINAYSLEVGFGHRHLVFLIIPFSAMATVAVSEIRKGQSRMRPKLLRRSLSGLAAIMLVFSIGGVYNLYNPIGGWYPESCNDSEIALGTWLRDWSGNRCVVVSDPRLGTMIQGMYARGTDRFRYLQLLPELLTNPQLARSEVGAEFETIIYLTSDLMEEHFILNFNEPPLRLPCSALLDRTAVVARIHARVGASAYLLLP